MPTIQKSMRIKEKTVKEIERIAEESEKEFSNIANELLEEAVKTYRCPGIIFAEGAAGRRPRIAGAGIEVWELIAAFKGLDEDIARMRKAYHWLTEQQLMSAIGYYRMYPEEIDRLIKQNEELTKEQVHKKYPFFHRGSR